MDAEEEEKPIVHIDHRLYHDEPEVLDDYDLQDIPKKVKFSVHTIRGFDDVLQEIRRPPSKWLNHWAKLDYGEPVPVLFDMDGHPYIMVPAKKKPDVVVKVLLHEKEFEEIIDRLKTATDFCDYCSHPLPENCNDWLEHDGESIADIYTCESEGCESESIRWDKEFIKWHPILEGLDLKTR